MADQDRYELRCSFCMCTQSVVGKLIAGPAAFICDACIAGCAEILAKEGIAPFVAVADEVATYFSERSKLYEEQMSAVMRSEKDTHTIDNVGIDTGASAIDDGPSTR